MSKVFAIISAIVLSVSMYPLAAADTGQNRVLQLDGYGNWVELPPDIFDDLDEATVEAWVKWDRLGYFSQPFGFGSGEQRRLLAVNNTENFANLQFFLYVDAKLYSIRVHGILSERQWCHIAAVSGKGGMKLYLDGVLVGEHEYTGSFSAFANGEQNGFGKPHWAANDYFKGQLDQVRVWKVARTGAEIRASMRRRLTGSEPGLFGLWNFDAGDARDSSPNGFHGFLIDDARSVEAKLPTLGELTRPSAISGVVTDESGTPLASAAVRLEEHGEPVIQTITDHTGTYRMVLYPSAQRYDLSAAQEERGAWRVGVPVREGEHLNLPLALKRAVSISGTLLAWDNALLPGVSVQAIRIPAPPDSPRVVATSSSDEGGQYRFINLKPGRYQVRSYAPDGYAYYTGKSDRQKPTGDSTQTPFSPSPRRRVAPRRDPRRFARERA